MPRPQVRDTMIGALFAVLILPITARAGWERLSEDTIQLKGSVGREDFEAYVAVAAPGYTRVVLKSGGGEPAVALRIAEDMATRDITVVVDGPCLSSCANYLALAGRRLVVKEGGMLGWHGSLPSPVDGRARLEAEDVPEALVDTYVSWLTDFKAREQAFFEKVGVDYRLLQDSADIITEDQVAPGAGYHFDEVTGAYSVTRSAAMWIPTPDVLERYGIRTDGFEWRYDADDIAAWAVERGLTTPYATRGPRRHATGGQ